MGLREPLISCTHTHACMHADPQLCLLPKPTEQDGNNKSRTGREPARRRDLQAIHLATFSLMTLRFHLNYSSVRACMRVSVPCSPKGRWLAGIRGRPSPSSRDGNRSGKCEGPGIWGSLSYPSFGKKAFHPPLPVAGAAVWLASPASLEHALHFKK